MSVCPPAINAIHVQALPLPILTSHLYTIHRRIQETLTLSMSPGLCNRLSEARNTFPRQQRGRPYIIVEVEEDHPIASTNDMPTGVSTEISMSYLTKVI